MLDENFLENLPNDSIKSFLLICQEFIDGDIIIPEGDEINNFDKYLNALAAFEAFKEASTLDFDAPSLSAINFDLPYLTFADKKQDIIRIREFFGRKRDELNIVVNMLEGKDLFKNACDRFRIKLKKAFGYQFTDGDIDRIQAIINELRDLVAQSNIFDAKHKLRILKKLEILQLSLHKTMGSLDNFWGFIGEAGIVLGKFGNDAKPFVDRVKEILQIVWRTQARAEELPSATPLPLLSKELIKTD